MCSRSRALRSPRLWRRSARYAWSCGRGAANRHFDLFARVCDVDPRGASWNVCDALAGVAPGRFQTTDAEGASRVQFDLWPVAHRFAAGNRIRLQVSSGAHPRYVRNPRTGDDPLIARTLRAVDVELLYGPAHPSAVMLPVFLAGRTSWAHHEETRAATHTAGTVDPSAPPTTVTARSFRSPPARRPARRSIPRAATRDGYRRGSRPVAPAQRCQIPLRSPPPSIAG
jgi:X-Pro dipeptidyl-peptidase C-terminal non-catalytic domain